MSQLWGTRVFWDVTLWLSCAASPSPRLHEAVSTGAQCHQSWQMPQAESQLCYFPLFPCSLGFCPVYALISCQLISALKKPLIFNLFSYFQQEGMIWVIRLPYCQKENPAGLVCVKHKEKKMMPNKMHRLANKTALIF